MPGPAKRMEMNGSRRHDGSYVLKQWYWKTIQAAYPRRASSQAVGCGLPFSRRPPGWQNLGSAAMHHDLTSEPYVLYCFHFGTESDACLCCCCCFSASIMSSKSESESESKSDTSSVAVIVARPFSSSSCSCKGRSSCSKESLSWWRSRS